MKLRTSLFPSTLSIALLTLSLTLSISESVAQTSHPADAYPSTGYPTISYPSPSTTPVNTGYEYGYPEYGYPTGTGYPVNSYPNQGYVSSNNAPALPPGATVVSDRIVSVDGVAADAAEAVEEAAEEVVEAIEDVEDVVDAEGDYGPIIGGEVWYNPAYWLAPRFWAGGFNIGISGSDGNADAFSLRTGFELTRQTERTKWDTTLIYAKNEADGVETQHNALFTSNWDWLFDNPRWSWFTKFGTEWDEFKAFDVRLFANTGVGYQFIDNDRTEFRGRFGAGTSVEFGGPDDGEFVPEAVFGFDLNHKLTERQIFTATVDYLPQWDNFADYRIVSSASWQFLIDEPNNLSLKLSVLDRYDSTPNGALSNDIDYSLLLLWSI